ncbi:TonB-dependent receptor [Siphonobacter sp. SORGH_AS_1065]|uniref:TonB-dependent receptor n=1 Tax=Siphonobacter sp. SORGH_AS_1065 TaxID=3041795 RepID=UPI002784AC26|nr:TonB-dependent receptor [Siphonobacter sp. SORGH_AS_1065]MDQ1085906.1 outer membrane receptor for ferrienterochelin and colicins [Siphonobacter sp. SORGH_AS_1065]
MAVHSIIRCVFFFSLTMGHVWAQTGRVVGKVTDEKGEAVEAASLVVKGTTYGVISDEQGRYLFKDLKPGAYKIRVSRVGMSSLELPVKVEGGQTQTLDIQLKSEYTNFQEVVVTGQFEPQSLKQSVFQVRTIDLERIQARAATSLVGVLNTELGIRFSNDMALGTSDIQLMGMTGRNVKILLDGVPMLDRGDTRESLNQIDINTIARIEIVEGPMSVSYGSDALAGVINIITKKPGAEKLSVMARVQEESVGKEYELGRGQGSHLNSFGVTWQRKGWFASVGGSRNDFGGWQGYSQTRTPDWQAKNQWLGNGTLGYRNDNFSIRYRLDGLQETIKALGAANANTNVARDQNFITKRLMHQGQAEWKANDRLSLNAIAAYTDYSRRTQTTQIDLNTGRRTLSLGEGEQDVASFDNFMFRATAQYRLNNQWSFQPGVELNRDQSAGARISANDGISDLAFYVSSEWKPVEAIVIRPGLRFIHNSVYQAPPVIPSINTKFALTKKLDFRASYARGFRSPALRELYFNFFDASHSIQGNPNLKAEYSNSFNGSFSWEMLRSKAGYLNLVPGFFYNDFHNLISYGNDPVDPRIMRTVNIDRFKTAGGTLNTVLQWKDLQGSVGYSYIGRFNQLSTDARIPEFNWASEINANLIYTVKSIHTKLNLFYKYTGKRTSYQTAADLSVQLAETAAFHWMDFSISKPLFRVLTLNAGVKNILDVTRLNNTATDSGSAHSSSGPIPQSYGRSYFLGLTFNWSN